MRMTPKAYKTNGILMISHPKCKNAKFHYNHHFSQNIYIFTKSQNFVKFSTFYRKVHFLVFCLPKPSIFLVLWKVFRLRPEFR